MSADRIVTQFADCAIAWGYCHSSGQSHLAEPFRLDLSKLFDELCETAPDWQARLLTLMRSHENPWVTHCAAAALLKVAPEQSIPVLEKLTLGDGMWALQSQVILGTWRLQQRGA